MVGLTHTSQGDARIQLQSGAEFVEVDDGTQTGVATFIADASLLPQIDAQHALFPKTGYQGSLTMHRRTTKFISGNRVQVTGNYFGLWVDPTPAVVNFPSSVGRDPIETHPDFKKFAGDPAGPLNGAKFTDIVGGGHSFAGFYDTENDKFGLKSYIVPGTTVYRSYWTGKLPDTSRIGKRLRAAPSDVIKPHGVVDWILAAMPIRTVGAYYQVTEQLMGAKFPGADRDVYGE